jgi:uncharacterized membrane protein YqaE (UPF0057 family)
MNTALVILVILSAPFIPGLLVALWVMGDEVIFGGLEAHGR